MAEREYWIGIPATGDNEGPYSDYCEVYEAALEHSKKSGLVEVYVRGSDGPTRLFKDGKAYG